MYMGSRRDKVSHEEEQDFLDELMAALTERWPGYVGTNLHGASGHQLTDLVS
jgi:hypothetical protein